MRHLQWRAEVGLQRMDWMLTPKNNLMLIAGVVWCLAGAMVIAVGLPLLVQDGPGQPILFALAVVIFLVFYVFIFSRLVTKHSGRIRRESRQRLPFWSFFDKSSYLIMVIMMGGGMALRLGHLMPEWMIAFFYSGLGIALFACGVRFLGVFWRKDVLLATVESPAAQ